ncbi:MAG: endolytic transglycosylase MltG [bacterium]|nr:endolytic transglycosylase MltG [bacterium]MDT8367015.1 endolytic transglycosylase MltG [bacterium]
MLIGKLKRNRSIVPAIILVMLVIAGSVLVGVWNFWNAPAEDPGSEILITIPGGSSFVSASQLLVDAGVIRSLKFFVLMGKVKGLSNSIQAGELMFDTGMTPSQVLDVLARGKAVSYHVTIPEGYNIQMVASLLAEKGLGDADRIVALAHDPEFSRGLGVPADSLEGFLFPDTYSWPKGLSEKDILGRMVAKYNSVFTDAMRARAREMGMTELEVVTLASIIEKETGAPEEREQVSAVFHNRLKKGYRLQTDPTVIYGIENFNGNLTKKDLRTDHPYNTYTRSGLPVAPIANPGKASLMAALSPAKVSYLYFVARGDGTHVFSNNLVEHNKAVAIYQLGEAPR